MSSFSWLFFAIFTKFWTLTPCKIIFFVVDPPIPLNDNLVLMYSLSNFTYNQNFFKSKYLQHIEYIGLIAGKEVHYHMNITKHIRLYILYKNFCFIPSCLDWICLWFYHFSKSFSKFPLEEADEGNLMITN